jgi:hypothetical protein
MNSGIISIKGFRTRLICSFEIRIGYVMLRSALRFEVVFRGPVEAQSVVRLTLETFAERNDWNLLRNPMRTASEPDVEAFVRYWYVFIFFG